MESLSQGEIMSKRQSIEPTYDHRETGDRYHVTSTINGRSVAWQVPITDPFMRHTVHIGWRDLLRGLVKRRLEVTVFVGGDKDIVEDVMELNADYLGLMDSTRRDEFKVSLGASLETFGAAISYPDDDEGG